MGPLLWIIRGCLLAVVLLHIYYTIRLTIENRHARPELYRRKDTVKATLASRSMAMSGLVLLAFIYDNFPAPVIAPAEIFFEPDVENYKQITASHFLDF